MEAFIISQTCSYAEYFKLSASKQGFDKINFCIIKVNLIFFIYKELNSIYFSYVIIF
ncbi:hypothetical protein BSG1_21475 [Bacillus sp. SG-1]|nr:hypothetical protein BSG1_21475 [Bacillus sp. SG-1]